MPLPSYCQQQVTAALLATVSTPGNQLLWYNTASGGTGSTLAPVPSSAIPGSVNYYVSQSDGLCESPRSVITVTVNSKPVLGADRTIAICEGEAADLNTSFNTSGYSTVSWTLKQVPVLNPSSVITPGIYRLIVQNASGCVDTAFVTASLQPAALANAGPDNNAEYNFPYTLSGSGGIIYQWTPAGPLNNPFIANPVAILTQDQAFVLMVQNEFGCTDRDTVNIHVLAGPAIYVPTAFTPNGDGLNDVFRPIPVSITTLEFFRVFNRYGDLVFETRELNKGWDGAIKGLKQNTGNFVWQVKGTDRTGKVHIQKGNVILIR
jgi:gliding motility-associated-like protein